VSDLDPFDDAFLSDPYPRYAQLREMGPVVLLERYGVFCLARYAEVHRTLNDWQTFCSGRGVGLADFAKEPPWRALSLLLEADPPLHTKARAVVARVLSAKALQALRGTFAAEAEQLVDNLVKRGRFDGMIDLAQVYPVKVFPDAMGLSEAGRENLHPYGDMVFNAYGPRNHLLDRSMRNAEQVNGWIIAQCERGALAADGFGAQIYAAAAAAELTEQDAALLVRSFLTAGVDTSVTGLGAALYAFSRNPEQWALLREDPSLVRVAFDEVLRLESPVQIFFRTCTRAVEVGGAMLPEAAKVLMSLASANRDPRRWADPDRFDIRRRTTGHVAFGAGIHTCIGQMVARMEVELVLGALARRVERFEIAGEVTWRLNNSMRACASLPLAVR
jgi:cytochrome P450